MRRWLSRWCRPIDGSSSTYNTPDEIAADLRRESNPLRLAARQGAAPRQREVVEADIEQEGQARADFFDDPFGNHPVAFV